MHEKKGTIHTLDNEIEINHPATTTKKLNF